MMQKTEFKKINQETIHKPVYSLEQLSRIAEGFNVNKILKHHAYQNKPLDFKQAYLLGAFTLSPFVESLQEVFTVPRERIMVQSVAALCSLHNKEIYANSQSAEQIAGICAAVFDYDIRVSPNGYIELRCLELGKFDKNDFVMDNCGMGGDLFRTPNLSTIAALIAAADGIKILKHGSPGNTDSVGSSDFLKYCGVNLFPSKEKVEAAISTLGFGYTDALDEKYKKIHTQTHGYAGLAHMNDIIGPITNPVNPEYMKKRIIGINHLIPPERVAQAYNILNEKGVTYVDHGLFIRGFADEKRNGGIDEASIMTGGTKIAELKNGSIRVYDVFAKDFGLEEITAEELNPGDNKAETSRCILSGEIKDERKHSALKDAALANAGLLFYLAKGIDLKEGVGRAREMLNSKKAYRLLQKYAKYSLEVI